MAFDWFTNLFGKKKTEQSQQKGIGPSPSALTTRLMKESIPLEPVASHLPTVPAYPEQVNSHPKGLEESYLEKQIKQKAMDRGTLIEEDIPYLEQYLHPKYDILPRQSLRPTVNPRGLDPSMDFRKMGLVSKVNPFEHTGYNTAGLGKFKIDESHPDYTSIYDEWDFNTDAPLSEGILFPKFEDYVAKKFMQQIGKPYAIYERLPKK